jgi:hypothetical protein
MPQIILIKDLKNTAEISELVHEAKEPVYIKKMDMETWSL